MPRALRLSGLAGLFAVGALVAWSLGAAGRVADTTTGDTNAALETTVAETLTTSETTTEAAAVSTPVTVTVRVTTTRFVPVTGSGSESASSDEGTAAWVWALLAILAVALIVVIVLFFRHGRGAVPPEQRRRHLDAAVASWTAQGWAIDSETADSAVLRRANEAMLVSVDAMGQVTTRPLPGT